MKALPLLAALLLTAAPPLYAADAHAHAHAPLHGGVVSEVKDIDYELVVAPEGKGPVQLHLRDHGKPLDVAGGTARLTLLVGTEKKELDLKAAGQRFECGECAPGKIPPGAKAVARVALPGKAAVTVRFVLK